jgi:hypothetical protein
VFEFVTEVLSAGAGMRGRITDILSPGDEPGGQGAGMDRTGDGLGTNVSLSCLARH